MEGECREGRVKCRKRQHRSKSSSVSPSSPEVKVQKLAEDVHVKDNDDELELTEEPTEVETGRGLPTEGYWSHYQSLCHALPGRETQIEQLLTLFGEVIKLRVESCSPVTLT